MEPTDLTLEISHKLPSFPGSPIPQFIPWSKIKTDGYNLELLFLSSHSGTHIDAPYHFVEKGSKIHEIAPKRLICKAVLIKLKKKSDQSITKDDIIRFEKNMAKLKEILLLFLQLVGIKIYKKNHILKIILD